MQCKECGIIVVVDQAQAQRLSLVVVLGAPTLPLLVLLFLLSFSSSSPPLRWWNRGEPVEFARVRWSGIRGFYMRSARV